MCIYYFPPTNLFEQLESHFPFGKLVNSRFTGRTNVYVTPLPGGVGNNKGQVKYLGVPFNWLKPSPDNLGKFTTTPGLLKEALLPLSQTLSLCRTK